MSCWRFTPFLRGTQYRASAFTCVSRLKSSLAPSEPTYRRASTVASDGGASQTSSTSISSLIPMALTLSRTFSAETTIANFCDHVITAVVRAVEEISSKEVGVAKQVAEIAKKETEIAKKETEIRDKKAEIRDRDDIIKSQSAELNYTRHQAAAQGHR